MAIPPAKKQRRVAHRPYRRALTRHASAPGTVELETQRHWLASFRGHDDGFPAVATEVLTCTRGRGPPALRERHYRRHRDHPHCTPARLRPARRHLDVCHLGMVAVC